MQLLACLVEQIHRERAEPREPRDQLRNLGEQLIEVEHGRDLAPKLEQRRQQLGVGRPDGAVAAAVGAADGSLMESVWNADYTERSPMESLTLPLDYSAIERILPHRYPFLLVDRITELEPDKRIVGIKNVSLNERYLSQSAGRGAGAAADDSDRERSRRSAPS